MPFQLCSAGAGEVKRCKQVAPKTQVPARVLTATVVRMQGSEAAEGKANRKGNIFKAEKVNVSYKKLGGQETKAEEKTPAKEEVRQPYTKATSQLLQKAERQSLQP